MNAEQRPRWLRALGSIRQSALRSRRSTLCACRAARMRPSSTSHRVSFDGPQPRDGASGGAVCGRARRVPTRAWSEHCRSGALSLLVPHRDDGGIDRHAPRCARAKPRAPPNPSSENRLTPRNTSRRHAIHGRAARRRRTTRTIGATRSAVPIAQMAIGFGPIELWPPRHVQQSLPGRQRHPRAGRAARAHRICRAPTRRCLRQGTPLCRWNRHGSRDGRRRGAARTGPGIFRSGRDLRHATVHLQPRATPARRRHHGRRQRRHR